MTFADTIKEIKEKLGSFDKIKDSIYEFVTDSVEELGEELGGLDDKFAKAIEATIGSVEELAADVTKDMLVFKGQMKDLEATVSKIKDEILEELVGLEDIVDDVVEKTELSLEEMLEDIKKASPDIWKNKKELSEMFKILIKDGKPYHAWYSLWKSMI